MTQNMITECDDFLKFQDTLKKLREIDDKIVYALNTSIPTISFRSEVNATETCKDLHKQLKDSHVNREAVLTKCINRTADKVKNLREQKDINQNDVTINKKLRSEQYKLHELRVELNVEEILKERSEKVFHERCRSYYNVDASS